MQIDQPRLAGRLRVPIGYRYASTLMQGQNVPEVGRHSIEKWELVRPGMPKIVVIRNERRTS
jgi:hypothetical protein